MLINPFTTPQSAKDKFTNNGIKFTTEVTNLANANIKAKTCTKSLDECKKTAALSIRTKMWKDTAKLNAAFVPTSDYDCNYSMLTEQDFVDCIFLLNKVDPRNTDFTKTTQPFSTLRFLSYDPLFISSADFVRYNIFKAEVSQHRNWFYSYIINTFKIPNTTLFPK
jgi:hypothetical protein